MSKHRLINLTMSGFLAGIYVGTPYSSLRSGLLLVVALLMFLFIRAFPVAGWTVVACLAGLLYVSSWRSIHRVTFPATFSGAATITEVPDKRQDKTFLTVQPDNSRGKLLVKTAPFPQYQYGDRLKVSGTVEKPEAFSGFDYPLYLERVGIYGIIRQPKITFLQTAHFSPLGSLYALRAHVEGLVQQYVVEPESSFLNGILLGSKRAIPEDVQAALKATGTSHIIAISGANITILLNLLLQFLPIYDRRKQFWATVGVAGFVTILTGASASVLRGAVVASLGKYIRMYGRRVWATPLILFSLVLLLFNNPLLLRADPGFQLSFAAYAGLLYLGTPLAGWIEKARLLRSLPVVMKSSLAETAAASLGTAPLSFSLFGQLSLLGLVVNPLVLWLLPATTFLGLVLVLAGWLPLVGSVVSLPLWFLLHTILSLIGWFGQFSVGIIHWKP